MSGKRAREAIVFIPGLGLGIAPEKTKHGVVTRVARALDHGSATQAVEFPVRLKDGAMAGTAGGSRVGTISREDAAGERPILDFYAYEWSERLRRNWHDQGRLKRLLRVIFTLFNAASFIRFFQTSGKKTPFGRTQLALAWLAVLIMAAYVVVLGVALYQTAGQFKDKYLDDPPTSQTDTKPDKEKSERGANRRGQANPDNTKAAAESPSETGDDGATTVQWIALLGAAGAAAIPKTRRRIATIGSGMGATASYIRVGAAKSDITGGLAALLNDISRERDYERITVIAYSFGSIVALDTLFPTTGPPAQSLKPVKQLITIGSPFDFVTALKHTWCDGRHVLPGVPKRWINVFSPIDLMGSNYRDDRATDAAAHATRGLGEAAGEVAVKPTDNISWNLGVESTFTNLLEFHGFASHGLYWGSDRDIEHNVFDVVVATAYADTDFLD